MLAKWAGLQGDLGRRICEICEIIVDSVGQDFCEICGVFAKFVKSAELAKFAEFSKRCDLFCEMSPNFLSRRVLSEQAAQAM